MGKLETNAYSLLNAPPINFVSAIIAYWSTPLASSVRSMISADSARSAGSTLPISSIYALRASVSPTEPKFQRRTSSNTHVPQDTQNWLGESTTACLPTRPSRASQWGCPLEASAITRPTLILRIQTSSLLWKKTRSVASTQMAFLTATPDQATLFIRSCRFCWRMPLRTIWTVITTQTLKSETLTAKTYWTI